MKCKQFEIWLADLNPRFGTEPGKTRPVLIVQSNLLNKAHPSTLICPITSNVKKGVTILRVTIDKSKDGLKKESAVMVDQVRAIDNKRLVKNIGNLPKELEEKVKENLKIVMDLGF
ncbi:MAG: type II toxin-antitoxin system PemK/MazF family toxin [Phaeodactylibacter sp.]|nr:type II toxin-antitoxin system PemK/MazF family toxin [Phaeodactylibacter sp.]MCB9263795.1 type II toxin-antitoxin system PemK/MazF family toxin [Lewinellaceae bacterium]MCB9288284.1 type II toxin-antitoxin system PemK/MazF family toxin [Lewinellaceae bacterium]